MIEARARKFQRLVDPYLLLLLILTLPALVPLAAPGYFYAAHDGRHTVFYLSMFDAGLRDGDWWPTWAMHHIQGYGYPTFLIQAPIGFYVGAFFAWLGAGYTTAVKLTWATGFLAGAWGMYRLVHYWLSDLPGPTTSPFAVTKQIDSPRAAALIAALLYVYSPYHLVDIYVRAALNDSLLLAWFPWVLLAFDRLLRSGGGAGWQRRLATATLLLAGTLLTHTFALISFAPLLVGFVLLLLLVHLFSTTEHRWQGLLERVLLGGVAGGGALLLCVAFLLPLFLEGRYLDQQVYVTETYDFRRHFIYIGQYFSPLWGFGYSDDPMGAADGMSFQVGVLPLVLSIAGLALPWRHSALRWLAGGLAGGTVALLLLMSPLAQPLWEAIPPLAMIQFPWRLLALVILLITPLAGLVCHELILVDLHVPHASLGREQQASLFLVVALIILGSYPYIAANLSPVEAWREDGRAVHAFEQEHPDMIAYTEWVQERPFTTSPMSQDYRAAEYNEQRGYTPTLTRLSIIRGVGTVTNHYSRGASFGGTVRLSTEAIVRINLYYFPGWQVLLDGEPVHHRVSGEQGLIEIDVPPGEHRIDVRMQTTTVRQVGMGISGVALLVVLLLLAWPREKVSGVAHQS